MFDLYLASRSPRRRALLSQIGVSYRVLDAAVDEALHDGLAAAARVRTLAEAKARAGWAHPQREHALPVLGADTLIEAHGEVLGKPAGRAEGLAMLARLSGREHRVHTAVALMLGARVETQVVSTRVTMRQIGEQERSAYWDSGEPADKAGGYAVQGLGAVFVQSINGSYSGVVGLPLAETARMLAGFGIEILPKKQK